MTPNTLNLGNNGTRVYYSHAGLLVSTIVSRSHIPCIVMHRVPQIDLNKRWNWVCVGVGFRVPSYFLVGCRIGLDAIYP